MSNAMMPSVRPSADHNGEPDTCPATMPSLAYPAPAVPMPVPYRVAPPFMLPTHRRRRLVGRTYR